MQVLEIARRHLGNFNVQDPRDLAVRVVFDRDNVHGMAAQAEPADLARAARHRRERIETIAAGASRLEFLKHEARQAAKKGTREAAEAVRRR